MGEDVHAVCHKSLLWRADVRSIDLPTYLPIYPSIQIKRFVQHCIYLSDDQIIHTKCPSKFYLIKLFSKALQYIKMLKLGNYWCKGSSCLSMLAVHLRSFQPKINWSTVVEVWRWAGDCWLYQLLYLLYKLYIFRNSFKICRLWFISKSAWRQNSENRDTKI